MEEWNEYLRYGRPGEKCHIASTEKISKPVLQFTKDGIFIKEWPSGREVERVLKIPSSNISYVSKDFKRTAGKFRWKYK